VAEVRVEARRAVKGDLALRALAQAEGLEVTEEELAAEIEVMASRMDLSPKALREQVDRAGRTVAVRSEVRKAKALEWLVDHVEVVDVDGEPVPVEELRAGDAPGHEGHDEPAAVEREGEA